MISSQFRGALIQSNGAECYVPLQVQLSYDAGDPLAFSMVFELDAQKSTPWAISRELLTDAYTSPKASVGDGDVRFRVGSENVVVCLKSLSGHAHLCFPTQAVADFLEETEYEAEGAEGTIEGAIDDILKEILG